MRQAGVDAEDDPAGRLGELTDLAAPFAVRVAATLRIADLIAAGVRQLDALAAAAGADQEALCRLLRYLGERGVFVEPEPGVFALTAVGALLRDDHPDGRRGRLDLTGLGARMDLAFGGLLHSVQTGEAGYPSVHGRSFWADLNAGPGLSDAFDELMAAQQPDTAPQVCGLYDWGTVGTVVDVGGGSGALLAELLASYAHLRGTLVDRAGPARAASARFVSAGLADRTDVVAGDFFAPLPAGRDVYLVSRVLSDWNDRDATRILTRIRDAAVASGPAGRVLIVEVLPDRPQSAGFDLKMLAIVGGRARTVADFTELADRAGLTVCGVRHGKHGLTIIEAGGGDAE